MCGSILSTFLLLPATFNDFTDVIHWDTCKLVELVENFKFLPHAGMMKTWPIEKERLYINHNYYMAESASGQDEASPVFPLASGQDEPILLALDFTASVQQEKVLFFAI